MNEIAIPSEINGKIVTSIGGSAFDYGSSRLESVTIPDTVTSIEDRAFSGCSRLTSFSVSSGNASFKSEAGLLLSKDGTILVAVPQGLGQTHWESVDATNSVLVTNGVTEVMIPDSVTRIGNYAFEDCSGLTSVTIPDSVTWIGDRALSGCSSLTNVIIGTGATRIGNRVFSGCRTLTSFSVSPSNMAFKSYTGLLLSKDGTLLVAVPMGLTEVTIPDGVTSIGDYAFAVKTGRDLDAEYFISGASMGVGARHGPMSVTIPDGVTSIGDYAFWGCSALTNIVIPDSVTRIGKGAFAQCGDGWETYTGDDEEIDDGSAWVSVYVGLENVTIGNGVTSIGDYAFLACLALTSIEIPDSVTRIGDYVFSGCNNLESVTIGNGVTSIGMGAFYGCSGLTGVTIPDGVTSIGDYAFADCRGLTSATIPDSVTSIREGAFGYCSGLTSIVIPDSVTSIGSWAFYGCNGLTGVTIPDSVKSIGNGAFYGCNPTLYDTTTIPGVRLVDGWAVDYMGALSGTLDLTGVRGIGGSAFSDCSGLTGVAIPDTVTSIGDFTFSGCSGLTSVTIPDSVTSIGAYAFSGCSGLTGVTIPNSVTSIGDRAFSCENLSEVVFEGNRDEIEMSVFTAFRDTPWIRAYIGTFPVPANDAFANAALLPEGSPFTAEGVNVNASVEENDPLAESYWGSKSTVWWKWTAEADGEITLDTSESDGAVIGVFTGDSLETLARVASNAEPWTVPDEGSSHSGSWNDLVTFETSAGATYYIVAGGSGSAVGKIVLQGYRYKLEIKDGVVFGYSGTLPETLAIPEGVTEVTDGAFAGTGITAVSFPSTLQSIGRGAFDGCKALTGVTIPDSVTSIGNGAFEECEALEEVVFEGDRDMIGMNLESAFSGTAWLETHNEARLYTLTFDSAGGSEVMPIMHEIGTEVVPPDAPVREGFTFVRWEPELPATMPATNLTFVAVWEANAYTLTFDPAGGSEVVPVTQEYGTEVVPPAAPVREGFTFMRWEPELPASMPASNLTFTAVWEVNNTTPEIFQEEQTDAFVGNTQYTGWLRDAAGNLVGTITVKASKPNARTKASKVTATVVELASGKKLTYTGTATVGGLADVTLSGTSGKLNVTLSGDAVTGDLGNGISVEAAKNVFTSKDSGDKTAAASVPKKNWIVTLASGKGYTPFTLAVTAKGKTKIIGVLPDGTKITASAQAVVGDGGRWAVPVMYAKKYKFGFVAWFEKRTDGQTILTEVSDLTALRGQKGTVTEWETDLEACGSVGPLAAGVHTFAVDADDVAALVSGVNTDLLPTGETVTVAKGKWSVAKAAKVAYKKGALTVTPAVKGGTVKNASATKLTFTAKAGTFKGSFTAYSVKGGKLVKTKFTVNGAVVNGTGYGTAFNKKTGSIPVVIE
ncbi:MAG: leucine-rich repeat protein [Kiritimatiellae bacterium]|nr:leucine-rich repeat protein [Kiritimatiellia bacterium]